MNRVRIFLCITVTFVILNVLFAYQSLQADDQKEVKEINPEAKQSLPDDWMDCDKIHEFKKTATKHENFIRQSYNYGIYDYQGTEILLKEINSKSRRNRSINAYLKLTDNGRLEHPGIPKLFGGCSEGDWIAVAMKYLRGTDVMCEGGQFGDTKDCAIEANNVFKFIRENEEEATNFILTMTRSILELVEFFIQRQAFLEDFTATQFVFDRTGNVYLVDYDSIVFQDNDVGFLSGLACRNHNECTGPKGWYMTHAFAENTLGRCQERHGLCDTDTNICQGFTAKLMLCGFSHWLFMPFSNIIECKQYRQVAKCTQTTLPHDRCGLKECLGLLDKCQRAVLVPNVGYQPYRNYPRWEPMKHFLQDMDFSPELVLDIGSNSGFFSMKFAAVFGSSVLSFDTNNWYKGEYPLSNHKKSAKDLDLLDQTTFCVGKWDRNMITKFYNTGKKVDVQVVLSILHWLQMKTVEEANKKIQELFLSARVTFLELPQVGSSVMNKMKPWVGNRKNVKEIINDVVANMKADGYVVTYEYLATTIITDSNYNSPRELFAIMTDVQGKATIELKNLWQILECKELGESHPVPEE